jgi:hypothetical protein
MAERLGPLKNPMTLSRIDPEVVLVLNVIMQV